MEISYSNLKKYALLYITLPMFIFFIGYLKWYVAIICCAVLLHALYFALEQPNTRDENRFVFFVPDRTVNILFFVVLLWAYLGGMNGFYFQSSDWGARNAIFHDLINYSWPVTYLDGDSSLVYYIGFWLPAAVLGKFVGFIGGYNDTLTWFAAKQVLWVWASLGLFLVLTLLFVILKANTVKKRIFITLFFIFFSGMDLIGCLLFNNLSEYLSPLYMHLEWWNGWYQYSSFTTCLFWVFNQTIITWVSVACFLLEKTPRNYLLIGMACFFSGPIPFVGLVICMVGKGIVFLIEKIREKETTFLLKEIASKANILVLLFVFPVIGSYFLSNTAVSTGSEETIQWPTFAEYLTSKTFWLFFLLEAGIYLLLIFSRYKKEQLYYITFASLFFIPYFHIGEAGDFCMRASIPALFILMVLCAKYLIEWADSFRSQKLFVKVCGVLLSVCLLTGSFTPIVEFCRGFYYVDKYKSVCLENDLQQTLAGEGDNFTTSNPEEKIFFKYFAK